MVERCVEKVSFEPGMKQWICDGGWEWWAGGRWIRECDIISRVFYARLTEWDRKVIPVMRWCIAKWAIGDSQKRRCRWSREGDNRWGASSTRGLNRDQALQISRLSSGKSFIGKRKKFIFNASMYWWTAYGILRHQNKFQPPRARTTRYNKSFILYAVNNYQSNSRQKCSY